MVSEHVLELCQATETVSSTLAKNPIESPGDVVKRLYGHHKKDLNYGYDLKKDSEYGYEQHPPVPSPESLELARKCGRWGPTQPSVLFLQAFADVLHCLDADPMSGVVSPPLMGSHGTVPLTVISPLADIIRHCSNLIVRAEREVFFITCSWSPSVAQRLIKDALIELSKRAGARGQRVVVKMMYDKAAAANAIHSHQLVEPKAYTGKSIQLPHPDEIPNLDFEVVSFHKLVLGTLHAKFCVVDRKVAAVMSNNMEDNDNVEMMIHVEGPIVDSIYDTALITWNNHLNPPLPSHDAPATSGGLPTSSQEPLYTDRGPARNQAQIAADGHAVDLPEHMPDDPHYDDDLDGEITRMQSCYSAKGNETCLQAANRKLNEAVKNRIGPSGPEIPEGQEMTPYITSLTSAPVPMALVSRPPYGPVNTHNVFVPQNEAWLSLIRNAQHSVFIQTPDLNAAPLIPALAAAIKRGVEVTYYVCFGYNDAGEIIPSQGGTNDQAAHSLVKDLSGSERQRLHIYYYVGKDQDHPIHQSFKQRSCHIKLLIVDEHVGIQGSGNQDTQSWYHSQEINIMLDSEEVCRKWREGIERNQNTRQFGGAAKDGIWRDKDGNPGEGYMGDPGKVEGLFKGVGGMLKKMKDKGGF
jgi:phosphatidylserine/phosphatidylglycerophosphate/cardiolipin synthase-like enzyme